MNIYVYSDESGVFDKEHNDYFVFGGVILLGTDEKEDWSRKYASVEMSIRSNMKISCENEIKASQISNKDKGKLFRSLNDCYKFGVIIDEKKVLDRIFQNKKDKQRYLDYAYKIAVKRAFENLIANKIINPDEIERIFFLVDEHSTATNGRYELQEALEQEFKFGTYNYNYLSYYPPIFNKLIEVEVKYCNSASKLLIRAADIISNRIHFLARNEKNAEISKIKKMHVLYLP